MGKNPSSKKRRRTEGGEPGSTASDGREPVATAKGAEARVQDSNSEGEYRRQAQGERVRDAVVALAVAVLEVGGTETVVMAVVDRVREEGLQDCGEQTYYSSEDEKEEVSEELATRGVGAMDKVPISRRI